ncbi:MAG TPA: hypothetical protein VFX02_10195 [Gammaproteobacteria bacterium]|nr:hypothetical protein [Gammaproteobacteria bacterium]
MLSEAEIAIARHLIVQYRRFGRQWRILRWLMLLAAVLMLIILVFAWQKLEYLVSLDAATLDTDVSPDDLKTLLFERVDMLRLELKLYITLFLHAVLGPLLIVAALYGWNRWPVHFSLKARLLESALENELAAGETLEFMKEEDA